MPKPPPRKPLFCPPVSSVSKEQQKVEVPAKPKPGEKGWLENMMKKVDQKEGDQPEERMLPEENLPESSSSTVFQKSRPKPGEKGWLVALADSMETPSTQEMVFTSSQQSDRSREGMSGSSSQQLGCQEVLRPKPGEPGWLVAIANSMETNPPMHKHGQ